MTEQTVMNLGAQAIQTIIFIAGPMLISAMVIGVAISVLQAITQINEATLTFIPKMIGVVVVLVVMAPWMLKILQEYAAGVFGSMGTMVQ